MTSTGPRALLKVLTGRRWVALVAIVGVAALVAALLVVKPWSDSADGADGADRPAATQQGSPSGDGAGEGRTDDGRTDDGRSDEGEYATDVEVEVVGESDVRDGAGGSGGSDSGSGGAGGSSDSDGASGSDDAAGDGPDGGTPGAGDGSDGDTPGRGDDPDGTPGDVNDGDGGRGGDADSDGGDRGDGPDSDGGGPGAPGGVGDSDGGSGIGGNGNGGGSGGHPMGASIAAPVTGDAAATGGWQIVPSSLLLEPGQSATARLVHVGADGRPDGAAVPQAMTIAVGPAGAEAVASVLPGASGQISVAATQVGFAVATIDLPGGGASAYLSVTVADVADGVAVLPDSSVVFPAPGDDGRGSVGPWYRERGVGPFTWAEIQSRVMQPTRDAAGDMVWPTDPDEAVFAYPVILVDTPVAAGERLLSSGGVGLMGSAADVVTRSADGHTFRLVTLRVTSPVGFFDTIDVEFDSAAFGILGAPEPEFYAGPDETPDETGLPLRGAGRAFTAAPLAAPLAAPPHPADAPDADSKMCTAGAAGSGVELTSKLGGRMQPGFHAALRLGPGDVAEFDVRIRFSGELSASLGFKAQTSLETSFDCKLADLAEFKFPVAPAPLNAFLTGLIRIEPHFAGSIKLVGGPSFEASIVCKAGLELEAGFTMHSVTGYKPIKSVEASRGCEKKSGVTDSGYENGMGPKATVEAALGLKLVLPTFVRIGGEATEQLEKWLGVKDLGLVQLLEGELGSQRKIVWESDGQVTDAKRASSINQNEFAAAVALKSSAVGWLLSKFSTKKADDLSSLTILELGPLVYLQTYRNLNPATGFPRAAAAATVEGDVQPLAQGEDVTFEVKTKLAPALSSPLNENAPDVFGMAVWAKFAGETSWTKLSGGLTGFSSTSTSDDVTSTIDFLPDEDFCVKSSDPAGTTLLFLLKTRLMGEIMTPGYGGTLTVRCDDPELVVEPEALSFSHEDLADPDGNYDEVTLELKRWQMLQRGEDKDIKEWTLTSTTPDWLTIAADQDVHSFAQDGTAMKSKPITVTVDCQEHTERLTHEAVFSYPAEPEALTATLTITADCSDNYIKWEGGQPGPFTAPVPATALSFTSNGDKDVTWTLTGATATVQTGTLPAGEEVTRTTSITVDDPRQPMCAEQPAYDQQITITAPGRGKITATVKFLAIPKKSCEEPELTPCPPPEDGVTQPCPLPPCPECAGSGAGFNDPHMSTMDGVRFEAQILGEYAYQVPDPAVTDYDSAGPRLHARHEPTWPDRGTSPMSITAVSLAASGHRVEVYSRPSARILIDGVDVDLTHNAAGYLPGGMEYTQVSTVGSPQSVTVAAEGIHMQVTFHGGNGGFLNLTVGTPLGSPLYGFLGTHDGNADNDFTDRDGKVLSDVRSYRTNGDFGVFTDAWRIRDLDQSAFSIPYDGFLDGSPPVDTEQLEKALDEAQIYLDRASRFCTVRPEDGLEYAIAWELMIGTLPVELGPMVCRYIVDGTVQIESDGGNFPLPGTRVTVTAEGALPCVATSSTTGGFSCTLSPNLSVDPGPGPFTAEPPDVTAVATWPDEPATVLAQATPTFATVATSGTPARAVVTLAADPSAAPVLNFSGTLKWGDDLVTDHVRLQLTPKRADGSTVAGGPAVRVLTPAADGTFTFDTVLPRGTTHLGIDARPNGNLQSFAETIELTGTSPHTVEWTGAARLLTVGITLPWPNLDAVVTLMPLDADGRDMLGDTVRRSVVTDVDGHATFASTLPQAATSVRLTVQPLTGTARATTTLALDGTSAAHLTWEVNTLRDLTVSGTLTWVNGLVTGESMNVGLTMFDAAGEEIGFEQKAVKTDSTTGAFSFTTTMPTAALAVRMYLLASSNPAGGYLTRTFPVAWGTDPVAVHWDATSRLVTVSGLYTEKGGPSTASSLPFEAHFFDGSGVELTEARRDTTVALSGGRFMLPLLISDVVARVTVTFAATDGQYVWDSEHLADGLPAGSSEHTFDIDIPDVTQLQIEMDGSVAPARIEIIGHRWDSGTLLPWEQKGATAMERTSMTVNRGGAVGELVTFRGSVPTDVTVVTVRQLDNDGTVYATSHHDLRGTLSSSVTLDVPEVRADTVLLRVTGDLVCDKPNCSADGTPLMGVLTASTSGSSFAMGVFVAPDESGAFTVDVVIPARLMDEAGNIDVTVSIAPPPGAYQGCFMFCFKLDDSASLSEASPLLLAIKEEITFYAEG